MIKITASQKHVMPQPNTGWSLEPGHNHFDDAMPSDVAERVFALQARGAVKVEVLDANGVSSPWDPSAEPTPSPAQKSSDKG